MRRIVLDGMFAGRFTEGDLLVAFGGEGVGLGACGERMMNDSSKPSGVGSIRVSVSSKLFA